MLKNYFKIAWRSLLKNKTTGFINIGGLAIGMAVALMIGLWLKDELSFNKVHKNYDQLAQVYLNGTINNEIYTDDAMALPIRPVIEEKYGSDFEALSLTSWNSQHILSYNEKRILKNGMFVEPSFPEMFSLNLIEGNTANVLKNPNSIVISESTAKILFGAGQAFGKTIRFDAISDLQISGVFKDFPKNSSFSNVQTFIPWEHYLSSQEWVKNSLDNWDNHSFQLFAQLKEGSNFETTSVKIKDIEKAHDPNTNPEIFLFPMSKWHLYSDFENGVIAGGRIQYVWLFGLIGIFVLILACINFMNLSTARSEKRAKEVGIRKTIGSLRSQLIAQFLSESFLVVLISLTLALALVLLSQDWFNEIAGKNLSIPWNSPIFWVSILSFAIFTGLLAGSYPAFYLSSFKPLKVLKGTFKAGRLAALPRQILVTLQFTVSISLIIGTIVVFQQIEHAKNRSVGYDRDGMIQFFSNEELLNKQDILRNDLLKTGAIEEVTHSSGPVTNIWSNQTGFDWEGKDPALNAAFAFSATSHEYGKTVGWEILEGRDFSRAFSTDTSALILNEAAVKLIGMEDIVGKTIQYSGEPHQVIGVIKNMVMESPWKPIKPTIFNVDPGWINVHTIKLKSGMPVQNALTSVEQVFKKHSPSSPFAYEFVDEKFEKKFRSEERIGKLASVFAFLAILISCLGLFGLSAFVAEQRTKEIGIRKVLGASVTNLWAMQSKGFIVLVFWSCLIATPLAWHFLDGWLADYDYRIELSWSTFLIAGGLACVVTLLTVSFQSIKAALMNPVESLKTE